MDENIPEQLRDYNWSEVFSYCTAEYVNRCMGYEGPTPGFKREDVAEIIALDNGENDEENWIGVFKLKSGLFAFVSAGCDYTGWGCREWGQSYVSDNLEQLITLGLGADDRERLSL